MCEGKGKRISGMKKEMCQKEGRIYVSRKNEMKSSDNLYIVVVVERGENEEENMKANLMKGSNERHQKKKRKERKEGEE